MSQLDALRRPKLTPADVMEQRRMAQLGDLQKFINEQYQEDCMRAVASGAIYSAYRAWCFDRNRRRLNVQEFKAAMESLGYFYHRTSDARVFEGLTPRDGNDTMLCA